MKKLLLFLTISITYLASFGQADTWTSIITNGFWSSQNYDVIGFETFKDTLYATCGRTGAGQAEMYRSGDGVTWTQVLYDGTPSAKGIASINADTIDGGYMWIATGDIVQGTKVYRTENGTSWIPISNGGFGNPGLWIPTPHMVLFQGTGDTIPYLYAAGNSHGGAEVSMVFRTPYNNTNPNNWDTIVDFNTRDTNVTQVTYFYDWNNKLYFGTNGDSLLYESTDGLNFITNTGVANDFLPSDILIACLIDYNGNLYAGTNNQNPAFGGQLYRTSDGSSWTNITYMLTAAGHQPSVDVELHDIDTANGYLWVTPYTDTLTSTSGIPIWRSTDNSVSSFVQSNTDGFGNPLIDGENPAVYGFKGRQYFGGPNYTNGGQIWRTQLMSGVREINQIGCDLNVFPNPISENGILTISMDCDNEYDLALSVFDITGEQVPINHAISANGIKIQAKNLKAGLYFFVLSGKKGNVQTGKFIIR